MSVADYPADIPDLAQIDSPFLGFSQVSMPIPPRNIIFYYFYRVCRFAVGYFQSSNIHHAGLSSVSIGFPYQLPLLWNVVGFEPTTPCLQNRRSCQLSYTPKLCLSRHPSYFPCILFSLRILTVKQYQKPVCGEEGARTLDPDIASVVL